MTLADENRKKGRLFIISAPSGAGKSTLCQKLLRHFGDMVYSVSHTTRVPRGEEEEGIDYFFTTRENFLRGIEAGEWAEWAEVHGNYYGTSLNFLEKKLASGTDVLLDIDVQGTEKIVKHYPDAMTVFIMPPSFDSLRIRMEKRGTDSQEVIARRLENAKEEMEKKDRYRHIIVNDDLSEALAQLTALVKNCRMEKA